MMSCAYCLHRARWVLNGGCDMKTSQSLLCDACNDDTTRCPIRGILRRGAGRERPGQRLRTMSPQSRDGPRTREATRSLAAPRRRRGEDGWHGDPRGTRETHRHSKPAKGAARLAPQGHCRRHKASALPCHGQHPLPVDSARLTHAYVPGTAPGNPGRLPPGNARRKARP
jgi:hypothetical protein